MELHGSCHCGAVHFRVDSSTPYPYQACYCSICRKTAGGGGYAINLGADSSSLEVEGEENLAVYRAKIKDPDDPQREEISSSFVPTDCASSKMQNMAESESGPY